MSGASVVTVFKANWLYGEWSKCCDCIYSKLDCMVSGASGVVTVFKANSTVLVEQVL